VLAHNQNWSKTF